jgi:hypothetical protein
MCWCGVVWCDAGNVVCCGVCCIKLRELELSTRALQRTSISVDALHFEHKTRADTIAVQHDKLSAEFAQLKTTHQALVPAHPFVSLPHSILLFYLNLSVYLSLPCVGWWV